jgi:hypothetical protein
MRSGGEPCQRPRHTTNRERTWREFGKGGEGKIRSFWVGLGLTVITFGLYGLCWYYFVNNELKDVGLSKDDQNLGSSSPALSVTALVLGGFTLWIAPLLSVYNYGQRILRAQRLTGVEKHHQINPITAFLLYFPGMLLIIPLFLHYWYVTKHQNMALRAAGDLPYLGDPQLAAAAGTAQIVEQSEKAPSADTPT